MWQEGSAHCSALTAANEGPAAQPEAHLNVINCVGIRCSAYEVFWRLAFSDFMDVISFRVLQSLDWGILEIDGLKGEICKWMSALTQSVNVRRSRVLRFQTEGKAIVAIIAPRPGVKISKGASVGILGVSDRSRGQGFARMTSQSFHETSSRAAWPSRSKRGNSLLAYDTTRVSADEVWEWGPSDSRALLIETIRPIPADVGQLSACALLWAWLN